MPTALDGIMVLVLTIGYWLFVNSLNIITLAKTMLTFPVLVFLGIFLIYSMKNKSDSSY